VRLFRHDIHALAGAYAVNAIDDEFEREKFERHMRRCQECAGEVRGLNETATRLAFGASMPPPAGMRDSVLSATSRIRQLPPVVDHRKPRARRWWGVRMPMLSYSLAMAAVGVAIAALITLVGTRHELDQAKARNAALTAVLSAPDSHSVTQAISSGGRVTLVYSLRRHAMVVTTHGLPAPPPGKVYQLWFLGPPRNRSAGLLPVSQPGLAGPVLSAGLAHGDTIGITIEPAGGTRLPTTTPILLVVTRG
jgi:anti-sigma-K factor RskA